MDAPAKRIVWTLRVLCACALVVSSYLAWTAFTASKIAGCDGRLFNCDHVLTSRWSTWFGVPVSVGAIGLYVVALIALAFGNSTKSARRIVAWRVVTMCGVSAGLAALWFIGLQVFALGHLCAYCLGTHICGLTIAGILLWHRPLRARPALVFGPSTTGVFILIGGQLLTTPPPTFEVEYHEEPAAVAVTAPDADEELFLAPDDDVFEAPE